MKLDRLHQAESIQAIGIENPALRVEYSPNAQEWYPASQVTDQSLVRYARLVNQTDQEQAVTVTSLLVKTKEVEPTTLDSTSMGIDATYGSNDVRKLKNLDQLFDGVYNNFVEFSDYAHKGGHITLKLGSQRDIKKIRAYIQDGTQNYLRDGKIQVSPDGKTWTDVVSVGDGLANETRDDSLTDGWTHDSKMPGNRYIEGELTSPVKANYLRVLFTADYDARFVGFSELVINDGEFVKPINDPTVQGNSGESRGNLYTNLVDGKVLTSYKAEKDQGELIYHLSEPTDANHIRLVSSRPQGVVAHVLARTLKEDRTGAWTDLGAITTSFQTFAVRDKAPLLDVKLTWQGGKPEFYELTTFHQGLTDQPVETTPAPKPEFPTSSKGDEAAPVVEIPEFTGGVNGVEAAIHEVPAYTEVVGTVGEEAAPVVDIPAFTGGVNGVEATIHEVPAYTEAVGTVGDEAAPVVEIPAFTGGVNAVEAAVHEVPEFKGGVNAVQAAQNDLPAYTGGANGLEAAVLDLPAYKQPENESHQSNLTSPQKNLHLLNDPATGVMVIGRDSELGTATKVHVQRVMDQALQGKHYDAYVIQLLDPTHTRVEPTGAVLVRLPLTGAVEALYDLTTNETVDFTLKGDWLEFTTTHLGTYAVVYKEITTSMTGEASPSLATEMKGEDKAMLPATGEAASTALFLAGLSLGATALFMAKTKKES